MSNNNDNSTSHLLPLLGFGPAGCAERFESCNPGSDSSEVSSKAPNAEVPPTPAGTDAAVTRGRRAVSYVVLLGWGHAEHHLVIGDLLR